MDETRSFGEGFADENLSLWPVYSRESGDLGHLVTRHSAQGFGSGRDPRARRLGAGLRCIPGQVFRFPIVTASADGNANQAVGMAGFANAKFGASDQILTRSLWNFREVPSPVRSTTIRYRHFNLARARD